MNASAIQMRLRLAERVASPWEAGAVPRLQEVGRREGGTGQRLFGSRGTCATDARAWCLNGIIRRRVYLQVSISPLLTA